MMKLDTRRWGLGLTAGVALAAGLVGGGAGAWLLGARQAGAGPTTISANRFALEGFSDAAHPGAPRAVLQEEADGSVSLAYPDADGRARLSVGMASVGQPVITLRDSAGHARAVLALSIDGTPHLVFMDENGFQTWAAP